MTTTIEPDLADLEQDIAAPSSPLSGLRKRRDAARKVSYKDLRAPGYEDPDVWVRFRALEPKEITRVNNRYEKINSEDKGLRINAALMALACIGIFNLDEDGEPIGDPATWPKFSSPALAEELGIEFPDGKFQASLVVEEFYVDKIDVLAIGDKLSNWSLKTDEELSRDVPKG